MKIVPVDCTQPKVTLSREDLEILAAFFKRVSQWDRELKEKEAAQVYQSRTTNLVSKVAEAI